MTSTSERQRFAERIDELGARARAERSAFDPPEHPDERAMEYLREGVGPAVAMYCESHTGGDPAVTGELLTELQAAMNEWLRLYARCYGVELNTEFSIRTAAELLVDTHDIGDTAELLTKVPE
jgi:hypothetical protein